MQFNLVISPIQAKPQPPMTSAAQVAVTPAVAAAQQTVPQVRTQTAQAPQATGKSDQSRDTKSGTDTGQSRDTMANAIQTRTNATGYRAQGRGTRLDVSV